MDNNDLILTQPKTPWLPIAIKYGIIFGLLSGLVTVIIFLTENFGNIWLGMVVGLIVSITGIVLTHREFKSNNGGYMSYGQGLISGLVMSILAGLISGTISYLYIQFVDPTILEKMAQMQIEMLEKMNFPAEQMDEAIEKMEAENTASKQLTGGLVSGFVGGLILSLIVSAFTKRTRPEFE
jgi:hypothetical protein